MTLETITPNQLADELHLYDNGELSERAVADLLRAPLARWGLSPRSAVLRHTSEQLKAAGLSEPTTAVSRVLDRLLALGECDEVFVGHERYLAPAEPRWMSVGEESAVFLSTSALPEGVSLRGSANARDITQRINVISEDDLAHLHLARVRRVSLEEWMRPLHYVRHAARRLRRPVRSDAIALGDFWDVLETSLAEEGLPLSADAEVRAVTGAPGDFFGRHDTPEVEGRWTDEPPDGVWCSFRRGYGEVHWHPTVIAVDGDVRRALDLFDLDEWRWAILARGRKLHSDEQVVGSEGQLRLAFPAPMQMVSAMDLIGIRTGPWTWGWPEGAPDLWGLLP